MNPTVHSAQLKRRRTDWFLPAQAFTEPDTLRRYRLLVGGILGLSFCGAIGLAVLLWLYGLTGAPRIVWSTAACLAVLPACLWGLSRGWSRSGVAIVAGITLVAGVGMLAISSGGIHAPILYWIPVPPLLLALVLGPRAGFVSAGLIGAGITLLFALDRHGVVFAHDRPPIALEISRVAVILLALLSVSIVAWVFDRARVSAETDLRDKERQLLQADKLASLGTLSAGVGHQINNPLTYISSNLDFVNERLGQDEPLGPDEIGELREALTDAAHGSQQVARIVRQLRMYTQKSVAEEIVNLDPAVVRALDLTVNELHQRAVVHRELRSPPALLGNASSITQVFANLLLNAAQSCPEETRDRNVVVVRSGVDEAGNIFASVTDNGPGIPADAQGKIFDPFFTTKEVGEGTGLGLSICQGIVRDLGGNIDVASDPGIDTTFTVAFPPSRRASEAVDPSGNQGAGEATGLVGLRVLVIDDEELIGRSLARILADCRVRVVQDARVGLQLCQSEDFDVVLCDLMMPELSGVEIYNALAKTRPKMIERLVIMTGGVFTPAAKRFVQDVDPLLIHKPLVARALRELIRTVAKITPSRDV